MLWEKAITPVIYVERKMDAAPRQNSGSRYLTL
jgi:hypothetical protein